MQKIQDLKYKMGGKEALALFGGYLLGQLLVGIVGAFMVLKLRIDFATNAPFMIFAYLVSMLFPILAFDFFIERPKGRKLNFNFTSKPLFTYIFSFGMMIGMMFIAEYFVDEIPKGGRIFGPLYKMFTKQMNSLSMDTAGMLLMTVFYAGILEEIIFRGIIMKGFLNGGMKPVYAILLSAFIFGTVHFYPWQFLGAFLLGLVLGLVYWKTKSLLLPILLHGFNNLVSSLLILFTDKESFANAFHVAPVWILVFGLMIFGTFYYLFTRKYRVSFAEG